VLLFLIQLFSFFPLPQTHLAARGIIHASARYSGPRGERVIPQAGGRILLFIFSSPCPQEICKVKDKIEDLYGGG